MTAELVGHSIRVVLVILLAHSSACLPGALLAQETGNDWIIDGPSGPMFRIVCSVLGQDRKPIEACRLEAELGIGFSDETVPVEVRRRAEKFELLVPIGSQQTNTLTVTASSDDGKFLACEQIPNFAMREAARTGVRLELKPADVPVSVVVRHADTPAQGAHVRILWNSGRHSPWSETDREGHVVLYKVQGEIISQITAWTDDRRVGGWSAYRTRSVDPAGNHHLIELVACRTQRFRIVDAENLPIANVKFSVEVNTGAPDYGFIADLPGRELISSHSGEAEWDWHPDWKTPKHYIQVPGNEWIFAEEPSPEGDVAVVRLVRRNPAGRHRLSGSVRPCAGMDLESTPLKVFCNGI